MAKVTLAAVRRSALPPPHLAGGVVVARCRGGELGVAGIVLLMMTRPCRRFVGREVEGPCAQNHHRHHRRTDEIILLSDDSTAASWGVNVCGNKS